MNLFGVKSGDSEAIHRGRILAIILWGVALSVLAISIVNLAQRAYSYTLPNALALICLAALIAANRLGYVRVVGAITVTFLTISPFLALDEEAMRLAYLGLALPIFIAGFLLTPWSSLVVTVVVIGLGVATGLYSASFYFAAIIFVVFGTVVYLFARSVRASDRKYRGIFENAALGIFQSTLDGRLLTVNPSMSRIFGYDSPENMVASISNIGEQLWVVPELRTRFVRQLQEQGNVSGLEVNGKRKDGGDVWFSLSARLIEGSGGKTNIEGTIEDITKRKLAEGALQKSEARTRAIVETATDAIITMTSDGLIRSFNPAAERIFGYAAGEVIGEPLKILMPERFREPHENGFSRYLGGGKAHVVGKGPVELAGLRKSGEEFPLELSLGEMQDEEDILFTGIVRDITERKEAEKKLRASEAELRAVFESMTDAILVLDDEGRYLKVAPTNPSLLYRSPAELVGRTVHEVLPREQAEEVLINIRRALEERSSVNMQYELRIGERQIRFDGKISPMDENSVVLVARDVTESKEAEEALVEAEARYRSLIERLPAVTILQEIGSTDPALYISPQMEAITGYSPEECQDPDLRFRMVHPDDREWIQAEDERSYEPGEPIVTEYRVLHRDGRTIWVRNQSIIIEEEASGSRYWQSFMVDITERKEAERKLREAEARFRSLVESMPAVTYTERVDESSSTIYVSPQVENMLGYSPREWISDPDLWLNTLHPDDRERVLAEHERTNETGVSFEMEYRQLARDGRVVWVRDEGVMVRDESGEPLYWQGVKLDITERKQAEQRLRESEERYRLVSRATNEVIWDSDLIADRQTWNETVEDLFGYPSSQITDTAWWEERVHPEDRERVLFSIDEALREGLEMWSEEYRFKRIDGSYATVVDRGHVMRDAEGEAVRLIGSMMDITERKMAEEELRQQNEYLSALHETNLELTSRLELDDLLQNISMRAASLMDAPSGYVSLIEPDALEIVVRAGIGGTRALIGKRLKRGEGLNGRVWQTGEPIVMNDYDGWSGRTRKVEEVDIQSAVGVPIKSGDAVIGVLGLFHTQEGRGFSEAEIDLLNRFASLTAVAIDNAQMYADIRRELVERKQIQEELQEATEAAQEASRAKSEFLANMSHEIRTPMNGVIGMSELLLDTNLSGEQREYAETIGSSGEALLRIINDILDFSKIEAGRVQLETMDFELHETVEQVAGLFAKSAHQKGLEIASFMESDVPSLLRGDPFRLRQILTNLMSNAIKFTEKGEVVLNARLVETVEAAGGSAKIRFEVSDTGIGLTPEQRERLFQAFSQADTSTTRRYGGTGLGLTISKRLVEMMGGEIGIDSEPGVGSTFWFTVLLDKQRRGAEPIRAHRRELPRGMRVLIVDDNATNRKILHSHVTSWGLRDGAAGDARVGLEMLREAVTDGDPYDAALLDMNMPDVNGLELAREIKSEATLASTRLMLLTSSTQPGLRDEAREAGIEAYLTKPVRQSEFYDGLVTVMSLPEDSPDLQETAHIHHEAELPEQASGLDKDKPRVLLAEDNPVNQRVATRTLEKLGYSVSVASNGAEAVEMVFGKPGDGEPGESLRETGYLAVLMDCQMPEMDGYEATAEIRRLESESPETSGSRLPIIALTANALQGDREKVISAGMDDYLSKPVKSVELDRILRKWISSGEESHLPESPAEDAGGVLDLAVLESLRELQEEDEPDFLTELSGMFIEDVASRLGSLREAVEGGHAGKIEHIAHTIKGSCGNMGARGMYEIASELQEIGASGELSGAERLLERLEEEFERARQALEAHMMKR